MCFNWMKYQWIRCYLNTWFQSLRKKVAFRNMAVSFRKCQNQWIWMRTLFSEMNDIRKWFDAYIFDSFEFVIFNADFGNCSIEIINISMLGANLLNNRLRCSIHQWNAITVCGQKSMHTPQNTNKRSVTFHQCLASFRCQFFLFVAVVAYSHRTMFCFFCCATSDIWTDSADSFVDGYFGYSGGGQRSPKTFFTFFILPMYIDHHQNNHLCTN